MFYVKEVKLNNFRCYSSKTVTFMPKINIIYGKNAVGKTTILESIAYLGLLKSFRDAKDVDLIRNGEEFFFIKAAFCETDSENKDEIIVSYNENGKKVKKNNYIYQKNSDYIGYFNVVTFDPSDLDIVKGAPVLRRSFLNINLSHMDKAYMKGFHHIRYERTKAVSEGADCCDGWHQRNRHSLCVQRYEGVLRRGGIRR